MTRATKHHDHTLAPIYTNLPNGERYLQVGNYIATICSGCNLKLTNKRKTMNVYLHKAGGYDLHLFMRDVELLKNEKSFILPKQSTKYYTFKVGKIAFIDSLNFLPFSLNKLVNSLTGRNGGMSLSITNKLLELKGYSNFLKDKIVGKGCFPYEHMNSLENFDEEDVPNKSAFNSSLTGPISQEKYDEIKELFTDSQIKSLKDLHNLYLLTDVAVLADLFEFFRHFCRGMWGLDPANYITASSMFLDGALKESKQELDLISDPNLYEMLEKSITGGFVTVVKHSAQANNIHLPNYDSSLVNTLILLLDFNGLYAGIQELPLPVGKFKEMLGKDFRIIAEKLLNGKHVDYSGDIGYWIEIYYSIPDAVAEKTDELPLSLYVADNIRGSDYMNSLLNGKPAPKGAKLVATHLPVKKAMFHIKLLELFMKIGIKVEKVTRVWSFKQKPFLKGYVKVI